MTGSSGGSSIWPAAAVEAQHHRVMDQPLDAVLGRRAAPTRWRMMTARGCSGFEFQTATVKDTISRSRRMFRARFAGKYLSLHSEGAGNAGSPMRPQPRVYWELASALVTTVI